MSFRYTAAEAAALERQALANGGTVRATPVRVPGEVGVALVPREIRSAAALSSRKASNSATPVQGPCQSIWIPNWTPALLNKVMHGHWSNGARLKRADKSIVAFYFAQSGIPKATGPRRLSMLFVLAKGKRLFDRDAPWKSAKDALADCGALLDDTPALCVDGAVSYARALLECTAGSLILLEDLT